MVGIAGGAVSDVAEKALNWFDHEGTDEAVCPFCGEEQGDSWELGNGGEGDGKTTCGSCDREFHWSRHVSVSYSTMKP